ncbi:MAG: 4Fe-4S binding protein [Anaerolineaceae bacterium]|jgi:Pyruvate/2-oxoacid:ferredoxin oxidoreductase delta subunit|nr:4Fe-4S binding protein [Anaerolineaceae bacterium]
MESKMNTVSTEENTKPVYQVKKSWLGISDWIVDKVGVRPATWNFILKVFRMIVKGSKHMEAPVFGPIYKRLMKFTPEEKTYSHGTVLNLNVDVSDKGESKVLPIDLVKDMLRHASYIASANVCLCRAGNDCQEYPKEVCCLFMSNSGRTVVDHKVGYPISLEDALARVDKAAELGLIGQALWVEVEQYIWGFSNKTMENFVEMCFCCPCCCVALNLSKNASRDVKKRFRPSGWTAIVDEETCVGCEACVEPCPQAAITMNENGKAVVNQEYCVGCGICKTHCSVEAIKIKQTMPMRSSVQEYFLEDGRLNLKI